LRTRGLRRALFETFNDGAWHDVREVLPVCRGVISPENAVRVAKSSLPTAAAIDRGMAKEAIQELRKTRWLITEWQRAPGPSGRSSWARFRIVPGQSPRFARLPLKEQDVIDIKLRLARGEPPRAVDAAFGLGRGTADRIKAGITYRSVSIVPEATEVNGHMPVHLATAKQVWVRPTAEGFARQARRYLSRDDIVRLMALLAGGPP
jgi:hypothetical protein